MKTIIWYGKDFENPYEKETKRILSSKLDKIFNDGIETHVAYSFNRKNSEFDCVVFRENQVIIIEFKNFSRDINGNENGNWYYTLPFDEKKYIQRTSNPFQQCSIQRSKITDLIKTHNKRLQRVSISRGVSSGLLIIKSVKTGNGIDILKNENLWFYIDYLEDMGTIRKIINSNLPSFEINIGKMLTSIGLRKLIVEETPKVFGGLSLKREEEMNLIIGQNVNNDIIVRAGAGTGKTYLLIKRIEELVNKGVPTDDIAAITFTRKAGEELLERLIGNNKIGGKDLFYIGTIHGFCNRILKDHWQTYGYTKQPSIIDERKSAKLLEEVATINKFENPKNFRKFFSYIASRSGVPFLKEDINFITNNETVKIERKKFNDIVNEYHNYIISSNQICYVFIQLLAKDCILKKISQENLKLSKLLIDEYQDISRLEFDIFQGLNKIHKVNLFMVGDSFQAIFAFRGALIDSFNLTLEKMNNIKQFHLSYNSRSGREIILKSRKYLKKNFNISENDNLLKAFRDYEGRFEIKRFKDDTEEAEFVLSKVLEDITEKGMPLYEIALLARRNVEALTCKTRNLLEKNGIEVSLEPELLRDLKFVSKMFDFLDVIYSEKLNKEDILSIFTLNPHSARRNLESTIQLLEFGNRDDLISSFKKIKSKTDDIDWLSTIMESIAQLRESDVADSITKYRDLIHKPFFTLLDKQNSEYIDMVYTKLYEYCDEIKDDYAKFTNITYGASLNDRNQNGIRVSTIHKSKGLEWKTVFLYGAYEETNFRNQSYELNEEKNILYVGITRVKDSLYILYPERKKNQDISLSSYFEDIV
jgi:DNA helicase II / ATP-dependent DNA helicase PcrA